MAHDIFISYSTKDKVIADALCANLESAGVRCWIAPRDIAPGLDWPTAVANAISTSRVMVLVFSAHSNSSDTVGRELFQAANNKLIIIPFKIDNTTPEPGKEFFLARTHWLDAMNPPTQKQIDELVGHVKAFLSEPDKIPPAHDPAPPPPKPVKFRAWVKRNRAWIGAVLLFLAIAGGSVFALRPFAPVPTPTGTQTSTPTHTPTPNPTQTPTLPSTPTPPPASSGKVVISAIISNGSGNQEPDEYVEIRNEDARAIQLQGWTLQDSAGHVFTFPNFVMQPGQVCRVYTNQSHPEMCDFNYGSGVAIWANTGDCASLKDSLSLAIDQRCYK